MAYGVDGQCGALADGRLGAPAGPSLSTPFGSAAGWHNPASLNRPNPAVKQTVREPDQAVDTVQAACVRVPPLPVMAGVVASAPGVSERDRTTATWTPKARTTRVVAAHQHPGITVVLAAHQRRPPVVRL